MSDVPPPIDESVSGTTNSAGSSGDESRGRMFPCEQCGADLRFHVGVSGLKCEHCGHEKSLVIGEDETVDERDLEAALSSSVAHHRPVTPAETLEIRCTGCGAQVTFAARQTATECAFCGSPIQNAEARQTAPDRVPVDGVLPFAVEKSKAEANLAAWVSSRWFLPSDFKSRAANGRFQGAYLPFFTFDAMTATQYQGERGEHYYVEVGSGKNKHRQRRTRWYPASGTFQRFFDDVLVCAAGTVPKTLVKNLEPWPLKRVQPFRAEFLAGFQAETYTRELKPSFEDARGRMNEAIRADVNRRIGGDEQRIHSVRTRYSGLSYKHLLLPMWLMSYRYGEKTYRVVVNAGTGEVQGERPWSVLKIVALILAIVAAGLIIYFLTR